MGSKLAFLLYPSLEITPTTYLFNLVEKQIFKLILFGLGTVVKTTKRFEIVFLHTVQLSCLYNAHVE